MSRASSISNKVVQALKKVVATDRDVYKRLIVRSGGDPLTGRNVSLDTQDILLNPQPAVRIVGTSDAFLLTSTGVAPEGSLICTVSAQSMSRQELTDKDMTVVMKDAFGNVEEFFIAGFNPAVFGGVDIAFQLVIRSKSR